MRIRHAGLTLLREHPAYRRLWVALTAADLGAEIGWMAALWLALDRGGSAAVGSSLLAYGLPAAVAGLAAGPLLDRFRVRALTAGLAVQAAVLVAAAGLAVPGAGDGVTGVYGIVLALGLLRPLAQAGGPALAAGLVPRDRWDPANFLLQAEWQLAVLLGPVLGGVLVERLGPGAGLAAAGAVSLLGASLLAGLARADGERPGVSPAQDPLSLAGLAEGLRHLARSRPLAALTALTFAFNLLYAPLEVALPEVARAGPGGAASLGAFWSAFAVGSLAGSALFSGREWPYRPSVTLGLIAALWGALTAALAYVRSPVGIASLLALGGLAFAPYPALATAAGQRLTPPELHGRVLASSRSLTSLGLPLGAWLGGGLLATHGIAPVLVATGTALLAVGVLAAAGPWLRPLDRRAPRPAPRP